jgi:hypothetical protein
MDDNAFQFGDVVEVFSEKYDGGGGEALDSCGLVGGQVASSCERGNETSGSVECGEFLG